MRSAAELTFRVHQELRNLHLWLRQPSADHVPPSPLEALPGPDAVVEHLRGTKFAADVQHIADMILQGRFPVSGGVLNTGPAIEWRRDYRNRTDSPRRYFRLIPYLDFSRVGDHKVVWDLNRHQHLVVLAQASCLSGDNVYVSAIERHIQSWTNDNPFMEGINWASALEVAFRALSWIWTYHLIGTRLAPDSARMLITGLYRHALYLEANLSIYFSPNTHLIGESVALHALGTLFPQFPEAEMWKRKGAELVSRQMIEQVREDGSHFEQSSYYHVYALDMFAFHAVLEQPDEQYCRRLARMAEYLNALMGHARVLPFIGDDDGGRFFHPYGPCNQFGRATLATCAVITKHGRWHVDAEDVQEQAAWWLGARAFDPIPCDADSQPSRLFEDAGLAIMSSGPVHVVADAGPFGFGTGGHSHSDSLSVIVRRHAEEILTDAGTYTYVADPESRNWFRGSYAHNTVRLDRRDQATPVGPFRWTEKPEVVVREWSSTDDCDLLDAACVYISATPFSAKVPLSNGPLVHRRRILLLKRREGICPSDLLIVCDTMEGPRAVHFVEQLWHPGETFEFVAPHDIRIGRHTHLLVPEGSSFEISEGWRSKAFGEKSPADTLLIRRETNLPVTMWALLTLGASQHRRFRPGLNEREATFELDGAWTGVIRIDQTDRVSVHIQPAAK